ncbi:hypothetical protein [Metallibacterium sp.]|uniref:hypothetical protein n=1 Tax=Metallibacterium sp. TaxID=2940281 RepID=UPI0026058BC0|nr:hypothetical protein [Metallibacterium sp.]
MILMLAPCLRMPTIQVFSCEVRLKRCAPCSTASTVSDTASSAGVIAQLQLRQTQQGRAQRREAAAQPLRIDTGLRRGAHDAFTAMGRVVCMGGARNPVRAAAKAR